MHTVRRTALALAASAAAVMLTAPGPQARAQEPERPEETYTFALPDRWQEANRTRQGNVDIITFLPRQQTLQGWRDMVILQIYRDMTAVPRRIPARAQPWQCAGRVPGRHRQHDADGPE